MSAATAYYYIQTVKDPSGFFDVFKSESEADTINSSLYNDILIGFSGVDKIYGNSGADYLYGNSGNNALLGGDGDDFLASGKGNDYLICGERTSDCAGYFYSRTTYLITYSNGYYCITDSSNVEGTDTIGDVEYFSFNGAIISASDIFLLTDTKAPTVSIFSSADREIATNYDC